MHPLHQAWESLRQDFDTACRQQARIARETATSQLNQLLRRLRSYQTEGDWLSIVADGASLFSTEVAIFELQGPLLKLRVQRGMSLAESAEMSLPAAFATAIETRDPVVSLRSPLEVGKALSRPAERARVLPITNGQRVVAILFAADQDDLDPNALELITGIASAVLERQSNVSLHSQLAGTAPPARAPSPLPAWGDLTEEEQTLHLRAQRFSRVAVAEAQMAKPEACAAGREARNVYLFMQSEIERTRDSYRKQFMVIPSMVDYLHLELVRVLADNNEATLGAEYPGALV